MGPEMMLASHWASGEQLPLPFLLLMLGTTYALIVFLGIGAYRMLRQRGDGREDGTE